MNSTKSQSHSAPPDGAAPQSTSRSRWRAAGRWSVRLAVAWFVMLCLVALPMAFTTTIMPPAAPRDPVTVYLADHGRTSSLALPGEGGGLVRYLYADWNYYVLDNRGVADTLWALFWPTLGTLGRQEIAGPPGEEALRRQARMGIDEVYALEVEREQVARLRARLDALVEARRNTLFTDEILNMDFVHHPRSYTYFHNSNHVSAQWLRALGCRVSGPAFNSRWSVVPR